MAKSTTEKSSTASKRQFIKDPTQLLDAILTAVGKLKAGESLEIRRVRDPKFKSGPKPKKAALPLKKKAAKRKGAAAKLPARR